MATMHGEAGVTFLELVVENLRVHGKEWTRDYLAKHGMERWERLWWIARAEGGAGRLVGFGFEMDQKRPVVNGWEGWIG